MLFRSIYGEGISNSILEFLSLKKPVLATDSGGTKEVVINDYNGFMLRPFDVEDLNNKIIYLLTNPQKTQEFGKKGHSFVKEKFELNIMVNSYYNLYKKIVQKKCAE